MHTSSGVPSACPFSFGYAHATTQMGVTFQGIFSENLTGGAVVVQTDESNINYKNSRKDVNNNTSKNSSISRMILCIQLQQQK